MILETLFTGYPGARLHGDAGVIVREVAYDSRAVTPGTLFFCVPGGHVDGHEFARAAAQTGAVALVVERLLDIDVPQVLVPSVRTAMGPIASRFFDDPSGAMTLVGVTGTNGKTTTTFMLEAVFRALGTMSGIIGTVETHIGDEILPVTRTTPEAIDLQRLLATMRDRGVSAAAMEASSEGLAFERVEGTHFACAIFTNLSQDHLNTHGTMDAYFAAKELLFRVGMSERAVVNVDDPYGSTLAARTDLPLVTFAIDHEADVRARSLRLSGAGSSFVAEAAGWSTEVVVPLPARHNVENALGVLAATHALGLSTEAVVEGLAALRGVPGRMEPIEAGQDFTVLVDYAHTPDSLEGLLRAAREITPRGARLVAVFGCGGDRDRGKRPLMGKVGTALADRAIITSDNPRTEDPIAIIEQIEAGARETGRPFERIADRREAIAVAIDGARAGDVIVIAGKGHETGQQFADHTIPFDDRLVAREILEQRAER
ncbi:MAG: UDP-N-acetylmuramoyl-L-alanyl-D-glutamate--2,6-diaminopimelate ligase [Actinomycetota bacterium]